MKKFKSQLMEKIEAVFDKNAQLGIRFIYSRFIRTTSPKFRSWFKRTIPFSESMKGTNVRTNLWDSNWQNIKTLSLSAFFFGQSAQNEWVLWIMRGWHSAIEWIVWNIAQTTWFHKYGIPQISSHDRNDKIVKLWNQKNLHYQFMPRTSTRTISP